MPPDNVRAGVEKEIRRISWEIEILDLPQWRQDQTHQQLYLICLYRYVFTISPNGMF